MIVASAEKRALYREQGWWGDLTISQLLDANVAENPARMAIIDPPNRDELAFGEPQRLTYAELSVEIERLAESLLAQGVGKGDILLVQMPNISELVSLYFACAAIGAIISPVPVQYRAHELNIICAQLNPAAFICCTQVKGADHTGVAQSLLPDGCKLMTFGPESPDGAIDLSNGAVAEANALKDYQAANPSNADDIFTICWTSGTTGVPKGVPRSHNHWVAIAPATYEAAELRDGDIMLNPFPMINMASIGGITMSWLKVAGTMILHHPFDPVVYLGQIATEKPAFTIAPPAILNMLLQNEAMLAQTDLSSVRVIGSGSAPLAPAMVKGFQERFGITVINLFGSNEGMSLVSSGRDLPDPVERASYFLRGPTFFPPYADSETTHMKTRLVDNESGVEITEDGITGELQIYGATVFEGYFEAPEQTDDAFTDDGYFLTGDLFQMTGGGRFYNFVGRCKDLIIRGGVNISPEELDQLLAGHPDLVEACTFGIDDKVLGERIAVAAVAKPDTAIGLDAVTAFLKERGVAIFKLPEKLFHFVSLPRNALNKIDRKQVRESAQQMLKAGGENAQQ